MVTQGFYSITACSNGDGTATITTKQQSIQFDSSPTQGDVLPGPSDLLISAFAACVLKNVERLGATLNFSWKSAHISVEAQRQESPPQITTIRYVLHVETDETEHRLDLLHCNIRKFGTIYNTLAAACDVSGEIAKV